MNIEALQVLLAGPFFVCFLWLCFLVFVLGLGSGVGTAPDLGNHFLLRQKVIKNRFLIPTAELSSRCALRSNSRRESEFLWGSALRFARAFFASFFRVLVFMPAAYFGQWAGLASLLLALDMA